MTKADFIAYGVPEDRVREFSKAYHKDIRELAARDADALIEEKNAPQIRSAIIAMLPTIKTADGLRHIMTAVNRAYHIEDWDRKARAEKRAAKRTKAQEVSE